MRAQRAHPLHPSTQLALLVFFGGLVATSIGSAIYHWAPDAFRLALDRLGMAVAFAGALGLAMAERVGAQTARNTVHGGAGAGFPVRRDVVHPRQPLALGRRAVWRHGLSGLGRRPPPLANGSGRFLGSVIALYVLAKLLELGDSVIFEATGQAIAGHSLKHVAAALAAVPVLRALRQNAHTATTSAGQ